MEIGKKILSIRAGMGYSQRAFAQLIGCAQSTVCDWEKRNKKPSCEYLMKILELEESLKNGPARGPETHHF